MNAIQLSIFDAIAQDNIDLLLSMLNEAKTKTPFKMEGFIEVTVFYTHKEDVFRIKTLINISNIISVADNSVVISGVEDKFQRVEV